MDLIKFGNFDSFLEIVNRRADIFFPGFALNGKLWFSIFDHDKIDLPFVCIPEKAEFHPVSFSIFDKLTVFEQLRGDKIFKSWTGFLY